MCSVVILRMLASCRVWNYATVEVYGLCIVSVQEFLGILTQSLFMLCIPPTWRRVIIGQWRQFGHCTSLWHIFHDAQRSK